MWLLDMTAAARCVLVNRWNAEPATDAQVRYLRFLGHRGDGLGKGDALVLIALMAEERVTRTDAAAPPPLPAPAPVAAPEMVTVDNDFLLCCLSRRGGLKKAQAALLGEGWPLRAGWWQRMLGRRVTAAAAAACVALRGY
jgi:hypothetical protein